MLAEDSWRLGAEILPLRGEDLPVVFAEKIANAMRLTALSRAALALGLAPGLALADARAREPGLVVIARDHAAEARLLARIVAGCARYTPMAAPEPPDGAILDIAGCLAHFGSEANLQADLAARLATLGVDARLGRGATPEAARARACFGAPGRALRDLPVEALEAPPEAALALRRAGLKTIGDLACRPRAMLAARFGDLALRLGRLLEEEDRRITPHRPLPPVAALRRFAEPIGRIEDALACLADLLGQAAEELERRHRGGRRFDAHFFRSDGDVRRLRVETGQPSRDPAVLMRLFRERLEVLADPLDPGFGFDMIRLDIAHDEPLAIRQDDFAAAAPLHEDALAALVDRLAARLGPGRILRAGPCDTHIPECAAAPIAPGDPVAWDAPVPGDPPLRPIRLFDPPQPVTAVLSDVPDGPPRRFVWRHRAHVVARWEGPERIAAEWWRRRWDPAKVSLSREARDRTGPTRDYYRVEDADGHRFWLFRHGLYERESAAPAWYIHGLFA